MDAKNYFVYILTNDRNTVLYTGITNNLERRIYEHKNNMVKGFTDRYNVKKLVWYDCTRDVNQAIEIEKKIKNRSRQWKIDLIETNNPKWEDLSKQW
jgi:putative endonuclease